MTPSTPPRQVDLSEVLRRLQRLNASANHLLDQLTRRPLA